MSTKKDNIAIDSNIFRNLNFVNYLRLNKNEIQVFIPSIVSLEVGYYFRLKGIAWEDYLVEIQKFNGRFLDWDSIITRDILNNAISNRKNFPFRHHFRDFIIGTQCEKVGIDLLSYNKNHFVWIKGISIRTPEEFLLHRINKNTKS